MESVDAMYKKRGTKASIGATARLQGSPAKPGHTVCRRCGNRHGHDKQQCPAYGSTCGKCSTLGHFNKCCKTKVDGRDIHKPKKRVYTVHCNSSGESDNEVFCLESVTVGDVAMREGTSSRDAWYPKIRMAGSMVKVKLDTGAEASVLPMRIYKQLKVKPHIHRSTVTLRGYSGHKVSHVRHMFRTGQSMAGPADDGAQAQKEVNKRGHNREIVVDELLCFLSNKLDILPPSAIIQLMTSFYSSCNASATAGSYQGGDSLLRRDCLTCVREGEPSSGTV